MNGVLVVSLMKVLGKTLAPGQAQAASASVDDDPHVQFCERLMLSALRELARARAEGAGEDALRPLLAKCRKAYGRLGEAYRRFYAVARAERERRDREFRDDAERGDETELEKWRRESAIRLDEDETDEFSDGLYYRDVRPLAPEGRHKFRIEYARHRIARSGRPTYWIRLELEGGTYKAVDDNLSTTSEEAPEHAKRAVAYKKERFKQAIGWEGDLPMYGGIDQEVRGLRGKTGEALFQYEDDPLYGRLLKPVW